jgi:hypothetical protein
MVSMVSMVGMGRAGRWVGLAIATLVVGGCGAAAPAARSDASGDGSGPVATTTTSAPQRLVAGGGSASPSYSPQFPLTLRRTGGIAGFDDRVVLEADGRIRVDTLSVHGRVCTLTASQQGQLLTLLATLRLSPASDLPTDDVPPLDPDQAESEPITISVTDDLARDLALGDPSLGEVAGLVGTLVSDVTLSVPALTRCTHEAGVAPG